MKTQESLKSVGSMPFLIVNHAGDYPRIFVLETDRPANVGRSKENRIILNETSVSAFHAEIYRREDGSFWLRDLESYNGTEINGVRIREHILKHGDEVKIGSVKALFFSPPPPVAGHADPYGDPEALRQEVDALHRKSEIERNNLKLLKADGRLIRSVIDDSLRVKTELEDQLAALNKEAAQAAEDLNKKRQESAELASLIARAQTYDQQSAALDALLAERETACEELSRKIMAGEKLYRDLDLPNSIRRKEEAAKELERLQRDIESSRIERDKIRRAADEASAVFAKAKSLEASIVELESRCAARQNECGQLEEKIQTTEKRLADLDLENAILRKQELEHDLARLQAELAQAADERDRIQRAAAEASAVFEKATQAEMELAALREQLKNRSNEARELEETISRQQQHLAQLERTLEDRQNNLNSLDQTLLAKQSEISKLSAAANEQEALIKSAIEKLSATEQSVRQGLADLETSREKRDSLEKKSLTLTRIIGEKSLVLRRLKQKIQERGIPKKNCPPLRLIDSRLPSLVHYFNQGAGTPGESRIAPVGPYALAACAKGSLHRDASSILSDSDPVLLLASSSPAQDPTWKDSLASLGRDRPILICWQEGQLETQALQAAELGPLLDAVSGSIVTNPGDEKILASVRPAHPCLLLHLPSPVDFPAWDFSSSFAARRRAIFISGDGLDPQLPLAQARLQLLNELIASTRVAVTLYRQNPGDLAGLRVPADRLTMAGPLTYPEYLRLAGEHAVISGFGKNFMGAAISGDAALTRTLLIFGDRGNAVEELIFPDSSVTATDQEGALESAALLLSDAGAYEEACERSENMAQQLLSFENARERIGEFLEKR